MKTKAAIARELGKPFEIVEAELDGPNRGEVLVKWKVAGPVTRTRCGPVICRAVCRSSWVRGCRRG